MWAKCICAFAVLPAEVNSKNDLAGLVGTESAVPYFEDRRRIVCLFISEIFFHPGFFSVSSLSLFSVWDCRFLEISYNVCFTLGSKLEPVWNSGIKSASCLTIKMMLSLVTI